MFFKRLISPILILVVVSCFLLLFPWEKANFTVSPRKTISVIGFAKEDKTNEIASFSAGVSFVDERKETAVANVNDEVAKLIIELKKFGIPDSDIETQNLSLYQEEDYYQEGQFQRSKPGRWRVSNTVEIVLRDVARASELTDMLARTGANNVYGPNFTVEDVDKLEAGLLNAALANAKTKAESLAASSNLKLGKVVSIVEGNAGSAYPVMEQSGGMGGGGGTPVEPGTTSVSKTVTVEFEID